MDYPFPQIESTAAGLELLVANDKLYFLGPYMAQGLPGTFRVAQYDGEQLCVIGTSELFQIHSLAASPDTLYGYVYPWDWDQQNIGQWPLDAPPDTCYAVVQGVYDVPDLSGGVQVFPNPTTGAVVFRLRMPRAQTAPIPSGIPQPGRTEMSCQGCS